MSHPGRCLCVRIKAGHYQFFTVNHSLFPAVTPKQLWLGRKQSSANTSDICSGQCLLSYPSVPFWVWLYPLGYREMPRWCNFLSPSETMYIHFALRNYRWNKDLGLKLVLKFEIVPFKHCISFVTLNPVLFIFHLVSKQSESLIIKCLHLSVVSLICVCIYFYYHWWMVWVCQRQRVTQFNKPLISISATWHLQLQAKCCATYSKRK